MKIATSILVALALTPVILSGQRGGPAIEPRILAFEARPATIRPGESAQLVWQTEATRGLTIEPELGTVAVRGSKQVFPTQTTTYTLRASATLSKTVTVTVAGTPVARPAPVPARADANGRIDGHPDFSGVYGSAGLPQGAQAPALKPDAEKFRIVRTANDVRGRTTAERLPVFPRTVPTRSRWIR